MLCYIVHPHLIGYDFFTIYLSKFMVSTSSFGRNQWNMYFFVNINYQNKAYKIAVIILIEKAEILKPGLVLKMPPERSIPFSSSLPFPVT